MRGNLFFSFLKKPGCSVVPETSHNASWRGIIIYDPADACHFSLCVLSALTLGVVRDGGENLINNNANEFSPMSSFH